MLHTYVHAIPNLEFHPLKNKISKEGMERGTAIHREKLIVRAFRIVAN